jgi:hypothetical protein
VERSPAPAGRELAPPPPETETTHFARHILALAAALFTMLAITDAAASPQICYHIVRAPGTGAVRILAAAGIKWF